MIVKTSLISRVSRCRIFHILESTLHPSGCPPHICICSFSGIIYLVFHIPHAPFLQYTLYPSPTSSNVYPRLKMSSCQVHSLQKIHSPDSVSTYSPPPSQSYPAPKSVPNPQPQKATELTVLVICLCNPSSPSSCNACPLAILLKLSRIKNS